MGVIIFMAILLYLSSSEIVSQQCVLRLHLFWWLLSCYKEQVYCICLVAKWYPTLCDPMDCSLPGSFVHGISQAGILEWVAISSPGIESISSALACRFFTTKPPGKPQRARYGHIKKIYMYIYIYMGNTVEIILSWVSIS